MDQSPYQESLAPSVPGGASDFWVQAMLPAFFVINADLDVVNNNRLALELLDAAGLSFGAYTFRRRDHFDASPSTIQRTVSIPEELVHLDHQPEMREFDRLFRAQRRMIDEFNAKGVPGDPAELAEQFLSVAVNERGLQLYAYLPKRENALSEPVTFPSGVKIAPTAGIRLNIPEHFISRNSVPLPNIVDIVCAWRILCHWHPDGQHIARLTFHGAQPAFHDASARYPLWQLSQETLRVEAEANLTRLWSHALGTDLRTLNSARDSARDLYHRRDVDRPRLAEAAYLWLEKAFSELNSHVGFLRIVRSLSASRMARAQELSTCTKFAPLSSLVTASMASALRTLIADREFAPRIHTAHRPIIAEHRDAWLDTLLRMPREATAEDERQLQEIVATLGVAIGTWDLAEGYRVLAPTQSSQRDDEAVTSRALRLLFEEYAYNALKALLKQADPTLWLQIRLDANPPPAVAFSIDNSCRITDPGAHSTRDSENEESTRDNQKGLFTNYRVFSELFGSPRTTYRRTVSEERFSIQLQFAGDAFVITPGEHC